MNWIKKFLRFNKRKAEAEGYVQSCNFLSIEEREMAIDDLVDLFAEFEFDKELRELELLNNSNWIPLDESDLVRTTIVKTREEEIDDLQLQIEKYFKKIEIKKKLERLI